MATFRARDRSSAVLRSPRSEVWAALTDADLIAQMTPYVTTLLVLALASQQLRMPAADGLRYRRGEAG